MAIKLLLVGSNEEAAQELESVVVNTFGSMVEWKYGGNPKNYTRRVQ